LTTVFSRMGFCVNADGAKKKVIDTFGCLCFSMLDENYI